MAPQGSTNWQQRPGIGAGLWNISNTCYLNSVLQCLTYTPPLANYLLSREHSQSCGRPYSCVMCRVQDHVDKVLHSGATSILPWDILSVLPCIGDHFQLGRQEDAHDFLRCILDAMQRACLSDSNDLDMSSQSTIIHQIFGSFLGSTVTCWICGAASESFEPFLDVLLDIKAAASVTEALQNFVKPEMLGVESSYRCSHCGQMAVASKTSTIHTAPKVLTLALKRVAGFTGKKITKVVKYPEFLDLGPYMSQATGEPLLYSLYAVLVHKGVSCHSGHYFCYIKASDGLWYKMDDWSVTRCGTNTALRQQAYILFYVRHSDLNTGERTALSPASPCACSSTGQWLASSKQDVVVGLQDSPEEGRSSARAPISQQSQHTTSFGPAIVGQQSQHSRSLGPESTGQIFQPNSSLGLVNTSLPAQTSAREASAALPNTSCPGRLSMAFTVARREPHHAQPPGHKDSRKGCHGPGPSSQLQRSSGRKRAQSRSLQWGGDRHSWFMDSTDHDSLTGRRMRTSPPRHDSAPSGEATPGPSNSSSLRAPPACAAQEQIPLRKRERSRFSRRGRGLHGRSVQFMESAEKRRRRNSVPKPKKLGKRLRVQWR